MLRTVLSIFTLGIIKRKRAWRLGPARLPRAWVAKYPPREKQRACTCGKVVQQGEVAVYHHGKLLGYNQDGSPRYKGTWIRHQACHIKWLQGQEWHPMHATAVSFLK